MPPCRTVRRAGPRRPGPSRRQGRPRRPAPSPWRPRRRMLGGDGRSIFIDGRGGKRVGVELAGGQRLDVLRQLGDPALDHRLGEQRVGLGLEIGDLGLELEPRHLALDVGFRRCQRLRLVRRGSIVGVLAADPRQEPVPAGRLGLGAQGGRIDGGQAGHARGRPRTRGSPRTTRRSGCRGRSPRSTTGRWTRWTGRRKASGRPWRQSYRVAGRVR